MPVSIIAVLAQEAVSDKKDLYPHAAELLVGAVAFAILFFFMWKWVLPRVERAPRGAPEADPGQLEQAEQTAARPTRSWPTTARSWPVPATRPTASSRRHARPPTSSAATSRRKAEEESHAIVERARRRSAPSATGSSRTCAAQVGEIAVDLAGRVVNKELDKTAHERLIDEYIDAVASGGRERGELT